VNHILDALEGKKYGSAVFLDVRQAIDRAWHEGHFYKQMPLLPGGLWKLVVSFLDNRMFAVDIRRHLSGLRQIRAGVPQGSVLGSLLYTVCTWDLQNLVARGTILATYADYTAFLASGSTPSSASWRVQTFLNDFEC